jgi:hypothetical protein
MEATVAITHYGWHEFRRTQGGLEEVNFWIPTALQSCSRSPFFFQAQGTPRGTQSSGRLAGVGDVWDEEWLCDD